MTNILTKKECNIIVDAGNSRIKVAQYQHQNAVQLKVFESQKDFDFFLNQLPKEAPCIVSNTGSWDFSGIENHFDFHLKLSPQTTLPYKIAYATPKSLGNDRRALAAAAHREFPKQNVLVLDLGTCLTADFIDETSVYRGGAISPGLRMRFKALNHFTAALPKIEWSGIQWPDLIGDSTENSILNGVVRGYHAEILAWIAQYQEAFGDIRTVITGGDASLLLRWMKNDIFAPSNFLLNGLDYILEYHLNQK